MLSMPTFRSLVGLKAFGTFREVAGAGSEPTTAMLSDSMTICHFGRIIDATVAARSALDNTARLSCT